MSIPLFVFDLDGTLVDSRRDIADAANALLVSCGAAPIPDQRIGRMVGEGAAVLVARAFNASGVEPPADALSRYLALYDERLLNHTHPYDGIPTLLEALGSRATLAVLTNKPIAPTRRILDGLDLARHFPSDAVLGGDGPFARKPDPAALLHLVTRAKARAGATMMVGDSAIDLRTARAAGTRVCLARYGFGFDSVPLHELTLEDQLIDAPLELLSLS
ncbi:MAG TPA: HAD hydrolase-like protein [Vicinamibacterales bacterium]|jgi:phosphoglycolate phosphatase|nr:HAD hydrolase-like protein [Vicinamibacterales bacterium]